MTLRHHMRLSRAADDTRWRCDACSKEGGYDELNAQDCPNGKVPYYPAREPKKIVLAERDMGTHVEKYSVSRLEVYERDERYERAKALKNSPEGEVLRRLGSLDGYWHSFSKIDGANMGDTCLYLMREYGVAPQASPMSSGKQCSIGFSEREQKWYGWSHRAYYGFGIGHVVTKGSTAADYNEGEEATAIPVGFECKTLDDCKRCAIAHAESVG